MNTAQAKSSVLVLDDEPQVLTAIEDTLESEFYVYAETSFAAAMEILSKAPQLSVILSDQRMPGMQGHEFLAIAREMCDASRMLITGYADLEAVIRAVNQGHIFGYISKPWNPEHLKLAVHKAAEYWQLNRALAESERRFASFMNHLPGRASMRDLEGRYTFVNESWQRAFGRDAAAVAGRSPEEIFPRERSEGVMSAHMSVREANEPVTRMLQTDTAEGRRWWLSKHFPVPDAKGATTLIGTISLDVTEQKLQEEKIARLSRIYAVLSGINSLIVRERNREMLLNEACRIAVEHGKFGIAWIGTYDEERHHVVPVASAGLEADDFLRMEPLFIGAGAPQSVGVISRAIQECRPVFDNDIAARPDAGGRRRQEAIRRGYRSVISLPLILDGRVVGVFSLFAQEAGFFTDEELNLLKDLAGDISFGLQYIAREEELSYLAFYDALTGLPNRTLFLDRAAQQLRGRGGEAAAIGIVLINLRRFRHINETLGRHAGDELLKLVARRMENAFRGQEHLARIAADSFGVMFRGLRDAAAVAHSVETRILECFREPFVLDEKELRVAAQAGIAMFPGDGGDAEVLYNNAEAALKRARDSGERYLFYATDMNASAAHVLSLETRLRRAVDERNFVLHYQPKIELATGRICGLEALIRWQESGGALVPPGEFIPLLEETGLILEVGTWVLGRALAQHREWRARGCPVPRIAVNVSAIQLRRQDFTDTVINAVHGGGGDFAALELEITESLLMKDVPTTIRKLSTLREFGILVTVDDFGTGYSSLSYLARLPIDSMKIDGSFVRSMTTSSQDMAIVTSIINLASPLSLKVVAEGVETTEQAGLLRDLKCDEAQGFLFSRPLPAVEAEPLLRSGSLPIPKEKKT